MIYKSVVVGLVFLASGFPQANDLDHAFSELQSAWRAGDGAAAARLFSDEISFITRSGVALKKQDLVSSFRPGSGGGTPKP